MGKFLCHEVGDLPETAFMRIYSQVPIAETQYFGSEVRANQAVPPYQHGEVTALKKLKEDGCTAVPNLLDIAKMFRTRMGSCLEGILPTLYGRKCRASRYQAHCSGHLH